MQKLERSFQHWVGLYGFSVPSEDARVSATKSDTDPAKNSDAAKKPGDNKSSGLSGGAIAGIIIGVLAGLAILIFVVFLVLRRRRQRANNAATSIHNDGSINGHSEMAALTPNDSPNKDSNAIPELGPPQSHKLRGDSRHQVTKLPYQQDIDGYHQQQQQYHQQQLYHHHEQEPVPPISGIVANSSSENVASSRPAADSEHVQAQRRREMEWLEQEEARMRQRREQLLQQQNSR